MPRGPLHGVCVGPVLGVERVADSPVAIEEVQAVTGHLSPAVWQEGGRMGVAAVLISPLGVPIKGLR